MDVDGSFGIWRMLLAKRSLLICQTSWLLMNSILIHLNFFQESNSAAPRTTSLLLCFHGLNLRSHALIP